MVLLPLIVSAQFVILHGSDGQSQFVNSSQITSMREPVGSDLSHFPPRTHCVIVTTSGKFIAVQETCGTVRDIITAPHR